MLYGRLWLLLLLFLLPTARVLLRELFFGLEAPDGSAETVGLGVVGFGAVGLGVVGFGAVGLGGGRVPVLRSLSAACLCTSEPAPPSSSRALTAAGALRGTSLFKKSGLFPLASGYSTPAVV